MQCCRSFDGFYELLCTLWAIKEKIPVLINRSLLCAAIINWIGASQGRWIPSKKILLSIFVCQDTNKIHTYLTFLSSAAARCCYVGQGKWLISLMYNICIIPECLNPAENVRVRNFRIEFFLPNLSKRHSKEKLPFQSIILMIWGPKCIVLR